MLLRFSMKNFLSFRDEAVLSMVASSDERHSTHLVGGRTQKPERILRGAAIYGANGHGKTNLVHAIKFARGLIVNGSQDGRTYNRPYKGSSSNNKVPSEFIFEYSFEGVDYEYGFKLLDTHIAEEWLFSAPNGREVRIFERSTKKARNGELETKVELGTSLKKKRRGDRATGEEFLQFLAIGMSPSQPYLTEAVSRNVKSLRGAHNWFVRSLQIVTADSDYAALHVRAHQDEEFIKALSDLIKEAGIGIDHIETAARKFEIGDFNGLGSDTVQVIEGHVNDGAIVELAGPEGNKFLFTKGVNGELEVIDLLAVYKRSDGIVVKFSQHEESAGTRRLINLMPMLLELSKSDKTYVIDELDRKLHPILSHKLLQSFFESSSCGQVVFTTHNTHLLDLELFRRDEIWFVEKDSDGITDLYSLNDMNVRPDVEIRRGYLKGRFGAIPFVGNIFDLGWGGDSSIDVNNTKKKATRSKRKATA